MRIDASTTAVNGYGRMPAVQAESSEQTSSIADKDELAFQVLADAIRPIAARDGASDRSSLDTARAVRIRGRVLGGVYNTLDVVDAVVRRILDSGDL
jgi:hypothetical protein